MTTTWILVANASLAKLYANHGPSKGLERVGEYLHPESREKALNLVSDRPGHYQGRGNGHGSYVPATDPKRHEAERFSLEIARMLDDGRTHGRYERLVLVASSPFIGLLKGCMSNPVAKLVTASVDKDYTSASDKELAGHLAQYVCL